MRFFLRLFIFSKTVVDDRTPGRTKGDSTERAAEDLEDDHAVGEAPNPAIYE